MLRAIGTFDMRFLHRPPVIGPAPAVEVLTRVAVKAVLEHTNATYLNRQQLTEANLRHRASCLYLQRVKDKAIPSVVNQDGELVGSLPPYEIYTGILDRLIEYLLGEIIGFVDHVEERFFIARLVPYLLSADSLTIIAEGHCLLPSPEVFDGPLSQHQRYPRPPHHP